MMRCEEFDEILANIEFRKPYAKRYFETFKSYPQWVRQDDCDDAPDFEEWMKAEIRAEKLNQLLDEED